MSITVKHTVVSTGVPHSSFAGAASAHSCISPLAILTPDALDALFGAKASTIPPAGHPSLPQLPTGSHLVIPPAAAHVRPAARLHQGVLEGPDAGGRPEGGARVGVEGDEVDLAADVSSELSKPEGIFITVKRESSNKEQPNRIRERAR